jgi:hypothetical protein
MAADQLELAHQVASDRLEPLDERPGSEQLGGDGLGDLGRPIAFAPSSLTAGHDQYGDCVAPAE